MNILPPNFCSTKNNHEKCVCGEKEDKEHIYYCQNSNSKEAEESFDNIYNGSIRSQEKVLRRFQENLKRKQEIIIMPVKDK